MGTVGAFLNGRACSDTLFHVLNRGFDAPLKTEERAAQTLAGGLLQHGYQCGLVWGAALAAGARAYRLWGPGAAAETSAIAAAGRLVAIFQARNKAVDCVDITRLDHTSTSLQMVNYFLIKGGAVGCFRRAAEYAPRAYGVIDSVMREKQPEPSAAPASCAARLARKMGASERHAVMAAGLAGGIGLSGGACGALGTAIWLMGMQDEAPGFKSPRLIAAMDSFRACAGEAFECTAIAGRRFSDARDHSTYLRDGGCARLMDVLTGV